MRISRRGALRSGLLGGLATGLAACTTTGATRGAALSGAEFRHGVASGEPATDGFLIWTRVSPPAGTTGPADLAWQVATDANFADVIADGTARTSAARDWTLKVDVTGLEPGRLYHYRFHTDDAASETGRSRTLPTGRLDAARFAVMSCSNHAFGHFNVYDAVSRRGDIDAVIHLGDYIYEYSTQGYGGEVSKRLGREHAPDAEIVTLDDYRTRHAQYKTDPGSRAMHAAHPLIPIWDDHETTNNSWENGAENHDPDMGEGDWDTRRAAALRAYYEWMPVRDPAPGRAAEDLLRDFQWGDLVTLATLETRLMARSEQLDYAVIGPTLATPEGLAQFKEVDLPDDRRELLGRPQAERLARTLAASVEDGTRWRVIANQIIMAEVTAPDLTPLANSPAIAEIEKVFPQIRDFIALSALGIPLNLDAWDGYPAARKRFYAAMAEAGATDLIVLTGDTHEWWANELRDASGRRMGVELGTNAVTSPGASTYFGAEGATYSRLLAEANPMVRHHDPEGKGYIDLHLTRDGARAEFVAVDTVLTRDYRAASRAAFDIVREDGSLAFGRMET
ncbi:alkaline phosphatase D family protein [uncultured Algimonas sp.]|uniref:alkaline phosphatase D family protein n=1 Tax=uncultured Algimonas sp. TaxID=1547920 RepID=UPI0026055306|nr:alkaline phosphatase D family protein [uncultured Algimonas sp.]